MKPLYLVLCLSASLGALASSSRAHELHKDLRHWEIASPDPDRIILTFHGDPATRRAVTWRTDTSVDEAEVEIAEATQNSRFARKAKQIEAKTETLKLGAWSGNTQGEVNYHSAILEDLEPDTLYAYRVGDGDDRWSEWIQFRTAKRAYAPFQFVYFGDAQNSLLEHWSRVIRAAYQAAPRARFAIYAGDMVNRAHRDREWGEWFKAGGFIHAQWTAIPVLGNHEISPLGWGDKSIALQWRPQFTLPIEEGLPEALRETVYTVDYQGVRIIVLNSSTLREAQTAYLERQLKESEARWKIVTCHYSIFSPAKGRDFAFGREAWRPLLDKYNVDLVLQGHDHTYARGHVPERTAEGYGDAPQTVYVTSISGPKMYTLDTEKMRKRFGPEGYQLDKATANTQLFQIISVDGNTLEYVAYTAAGEAYDRVVITKDLETGRKTLSQGR